MSKYFLIVDIGGTKTSGALFSEDGILMDDYVFVAESKTFSGKNAIEPENFPFDFHFSKRG